MSLQATYSTTTPAFTLSTTPDSGVALPSTDPSQYGNRPLAVYLQATVHDMRFTVDGSTPTSSHGAVLVAGELPFYYTGPLAELRFIQSASGSVLNVLYSQNPIEQGPDGAQGAQGATGSTGAQGADGGGGSSGSNWHGPLNITNASNLTAGVTFMAVTAGQILEDFVIVKRVLFDDSSFPVLRFAVGSTIWDIRGGADAFLIDLSSAAVDNVSGSITVAPNQNLEGITAAAGAGNGRLAAMVLTGGNLVVKSVDPLNGDGTTGDADIYVKIATPIGL